MLCCLCKYTFFLYLCYMAKETIVLQSSLSDWKITAQDDINSNFNELYAATPPSYSGGDALKFLRVNAGATALEWATVSGGVTDFTDLGDVPSSYSGEALKFVRVNAGETGLEFTTNSASVAWGAITGTLSSQTDLQAALDAKQSIQDYGNMFLLMGA